MANVYGIRGCGEPLFFFYDCEATGLRVGYDVIIEVAAVLYTKGLRPMQQCTFSSLCRSSKELHPEVQILTGLTKDALKNEPRIHEVLISFFDWIKDTVDNVSRIERRDYIPVLAAHGGHSLDFPLLKKAVEKVGVRKPHIKKKFDDLNLHYADTLSAFKHPGVAEKHSLGKFGLKDIYNAFFGCHFEGHRALEDAKALHKLFSDVASADELMAVLRRYIQSVEGAEIARQQIRHFNDANIKVPKAVELLQKGITFEDLQAESEKSEESFARFLKNKCGITDPDGEISECFKEMSLN